MSPVDFMKCLIVCHISYLQPPIVSCRGMYKLAVSPYRFKKTAVSPCRFLGVYTHTFLLQLWITHFFNRFPRRSRVMTGHGIKDFQNL